MKPRHGTPHRQQVAAAMDNEHERPTLPQSPAQSVATRSTHLQQPTKRDDNSSPTTRKMLSEPLPTRHQTSPDRLVRELQRSRDDRTSSRRVPDQQSGDKAEADMYTARPRLQPRHDPVNGRTTGRSLQRAGSQDLALQHHPLLQNPTTTTTTFYQVEVTPGIYYFNFIILLLCLCLCV